MVRGERKYGGVVVGFVCFGFCLEWLFRIRGFSLVLEGDSILFIILWFFFVFVNDICFVLGFKFCFLD